MAYIDSTLGIGFYVAGAWLYASGTNVAAAMGAWMYGDGADGPAHIPAPSNPIVRQLTDVLVQVATNIIYSPTASFTSDDVGLFLDDVFNTADGGQQLLQPGTLIQSVIDSTHAQLNRWPVRDSFGGLAGTLDVVNVGDSTIYPGFYTTVTIDDGATAKFGASKGWLGGFNYTGDVGDGANWTTPNPVLPFGAGGAGPSLGGFAGDVATIDMWQVFGDPGLIGSAGLGVDAGNPIFMALGDGQRFFCCSEHFEINGAIDLSGTDASGSVPATSGQFYSGGDPTTPFIILSFVRNLMGGTGGGDGGAQAAGSNGYFGGAALTTDPLKIRDGLTPMYTSPGGGYGAPDIIDGSLKGGAGGDGGKAFAVYAKHLIHGSDNNYILTGGAGGDGTPGGNNGGGGGGSDGWWMTISDDITGTANIEGGGGAGGAGQGTGVDGNPGTPGFVIHYLPGGFSIESA
jgi:hypothetical protein